MLDIDCWFCCDFTEAISRPSGSVCLDWTDFIPILKKDQSTSASCCKALTTCGRVEIYIMKKPVIDLSDCILCGVCQDVCPEVFKLSAAGYIEVVEMPDYPRSCVNEAIKNCPADCIVWE